MTARVYIIGFNSQERIDKAFRSIPDKFEKILLDNGATTLTAPDGVEYHKTGPGYFTDAFNYALLDALQHNAVPIVCNDDIEMEPGCIEYLLAEIALGAGLACPMQVDMAVPDSVIMGGTSEAYPAGIHKTGRRAEFTESLDYPWLPFCVTAVNPEMVRMIGTLDKCLRMWFSDSDYCIRARQAGWSCMFVPSAVVRHEQSASVNESRTSYLNQIFVLDQAYFAERKHGRGVMEEYS